MNCVKETLIFIFICIVIILTLYTDANANFDQIYLIPNSELTTENNVVNIVNAIIKDFSAKCPGEKKMKVIAGREGIFIQMICIAEEVNNESNYLLEMPKTCRMHSIQLQGENISHRDM